MTVVCPASGSSTQPLRFQHTPSMPRASSRFSSLQSPSHHFESPTETPSQGRPGASGRSEPTPSPVRSPGRDLIASSKHSSIASTHSTLGSSSNVLGGSKARHSALKPSGTMIGSGRHAKRVLMFDDLAQVGL